MMEKRMFRRLLPSVDKGPGRIPSDAANKPRIGAKAASGLPRVIAAVLLCLVIAFAQAALKPSTTLAATMDDYTCFLQTNSRWASTEYGRCVTEKGNYYQAYVGLTKTYDGETFWYGSGCGLLSLTNAVYALNGQFLDPSDLAAWSLSHGGRTDGVGTTMDFVPKYVSANGASIGVKYDGLEKSMNDVVTNHLKNGGVAVINVVGHFACLVDYDPSTGKYLALDSAPTSSRLDNSTGGKIWLTKSQLASHAKWKIVKGVHLLSAVDKPAPHDPVGWLDYATGGAESVTVSGWAIDQDDPAAALVVHFYMDGPAGTGKYVGQTTAGDYYASLTDSNTGTTGAGKMHGFTKSLSLDGATGTHTIWAHPISVGGGNNVAISNSGLTFTTTTHQDHKVSDVQVSEISPSGYTVSCTVSNPGSVDRVQFPTWSANVGGANDQDDLSTDWPTSSKYSGTYDTKTGRWTYRVNISDHKSDRGFYSTHVYVYDNKTTASVARNFALTENVPVPSATTTYEGCTYYLMDMEYRSWTWEEADKAAKGCAVGGRLATPQTQKELAEVARLVSKGGKEYAWVGATDAEEEGAWKWVTGARVDATATPWAQGEPNGGTAENYACLLRESGLLSDLPNKGRYYNPALMGFVIEVGPELQAGSDAPPVISDVRVENISSNGYTVSCVVKDQDGVRTVKFPTWTVEGGQDDLDKEWTKDDSDAYAGTYDPVADRWSFTVRTADHNGERGLYNTHIYAWDEGGRKGGGGSDFGAPNGILVPDALAERGDSAYYLLDGTCYSWAEADALCRSSWQGGHLATITSADEQDVVASLAAQGSKGFYWLGASDESSEGSWAWVTGVEGPYSKWDGGSPDGGTKENYLAITPQGAWHDLAGSGYQGNPWLMGLVMEVGPDADGARRDISEAQAEAVPWQEYTGEAIEPALVITYGGEPLSEGADYKVSFSNNVEEGDAVAKVVGTGAYEGILEVPFVIWRDWGEPDGDAGAYEHTPAGYARMLYADLLDNRGPTGAQVSYWAERLSASDPAAAVADFASSAAFAGAGYTGEQAARRLYAAVLGERSPSDFQVSYWAGAVEREGAARAAALMTDSDAFRAAVVEYGLWRGAAQGEAPSYDRTPKGYSRMLYAELLGKTDITHFQECWWEERLRAEDPAGVVADFAASNAFGSAGYTPEEAARRLYAAILGNSDPSAFQVSYWAGRVSAAGAEAAAAEMTDSDAFRAAVAEYGLFQEAPEGPGAPSYERTPAGYARMLYGQLLDNASPTDFQVSWWAGRLSAEDPARVVSQFAASNAFGSKGYAPEDAARRLYAAILGNDSPTGFQVSWWAGRVSAVGAEAAAAEMTAAEAFRDATAEYGLYQGAPATSGAQAVAAALGAAAGRLGAVAPAAVTAGGAGEAEAEGGEESAGEAGAEQAAVEGGGAATGGTAGAPPAGTADAGALAAGEAGPCDARRSGPADEDGVTPGPAGQEEPAVEGDGPAGGEGTEAAAGDRPGDTSDQGEEPSAGGTDGSEGLAQEPVREAGEDVPVAGNGGDGADPARGEDAGVGAGPLGDQAGGDATGVAAGPAPDGADGDAPPTEPVDEVGGTPDAAGAGGSEPDGGPDGGEAAGPEAEAAACPDPSPDGPVGETAGGPAPWGAPDPAGFERTPLGYARLLAAALWGGGAGSVDAGAWAQAIAADPSAVADMAGSSPAALLGAPDAARLLLAGALAQADPSQADVDYWAGRVEAAGLRQAAWELCRTAEFERAAAQFLPAPAEEAAQAEQSGQTDQTGEPDPVEPAGPSGQAAQAGQPDRPVHAGPDGADGRAPAAGGEGTGPQADDACEPEPAGPAGSEGDLGDAGAVEGDEPAGEAVPPDGAA